MSALAVLWKKKGWKVTGSDVGFYPPVSTHLQKHGVEYYPGWHTDKMGKPDLVVVGNVAGSENPEWKFVQENKISYVSYPELIAQNLVKKNSIVCAGTYGKTSSTILLTWILNNSECNPAYMFGGLSKNLDESADDPEGAEWSVLEGDEYKTARWDNKAKFFSYKPTHLLLTSVNWDHADIYPTEDSYFNAFEQLATMIPKDGLTVVSENVPVSVVQNRSESKLVIYGKSPQCDYRYSDVMQTKTILSFNINNKDNSYNISVPIIGEYMAENICGAFALAAEIGIEPVKIISALNTFKGIKRRMEKRGQVNGADVFDDIAHSPAKAKSVLETLHHLYCLCEAERSDNEAISGTSRIIAIFEPNTGNRQKMSIPSYENAFNEADEIIIPRLTKIKTKIGETNIEGEELTKIISSSHKNARYVPDDAELINYIKQKTRPGDAVVFLGSHGFRGMIDNLTAISP